MKTRYTFPQATASALTFAILPLLNSGLEAAETTTQMLTPQQVQRAMRSNYVPPSPMTEQSTTGTQPEEASKKVGNPTANAEKNLEIKALRSAGQTLLDQGNAKDAVPFFEKAAAKGDTKSKIMLADIYAGKIGEANAGGAPSDPAAAVALLEQAAKHSEASALYRLGIIYRDGTGVDANTARAADYFRRAIRADRYNSQGPAEDLLSLPGGPSAADLQLVASLQDETLLPPGARAVIANDLDFRAAVADPETAAGMRSAAANHRKEALTYLENVAPKHPNKECRARSSYLRGVLYAQGAAGPSKRSEATALFEEASAAGNLPARFRVERPTAAKLKAHGATFDGEMVKLIEAAASAGDAEAQFELASLWLDGIGREKDETKAVSLLRQAARGGSTNAAYQLGVCHANGIGTKSNAYNAAVAFRRAAEAGHVEAMRELGLALRDGKGVRIAKAEARQWLTKAAAAGSGPANYELGRTILQGAQVEQSKLAEAAKHYAEAARQGDVRAQLELLKMLFSEADPREPFSAGYMAARLAAPPEDVFVWSKEVAASPSLSGKDKSLATFYLASCYQKGIGTKPNPQEAARLFASLTEIETASSTQ